MFNKFLNFFSFLIACQIMPASSPHQELSNATFRSGDAEMLYVNGEVDTKVHGDRSFTKDLLDSQREGAFIKKDTEYIAIWVKDPINEKAQFKISIDLNGLTYRVRLYFGSIFKLNPENKSFLEGSLWDGKPKCSDIQLRIVYTGMDDLMKFFLNSMASLPDPKENKRTEWLNSQCVSNWILTLKSLYQLLLIETQDAQFKFLARCVVMGTSKAWEKNEEALTGSKNPQILKVLEEMDQIMAGHTKEFNELIGTEYSGMSLSLGLVHFESWEDSSALPTHNESLVSLDIQGSDDSDGTVYSI